MLLYDDKVVTAKELCKLTGVDFDTINDNGTFEIGGIESNMYKKYKKRPGGINIPCLVKYKTPDGTTHNIVYKEGEKPSMAIKGTVLMVDYPAKLEIFRESVLTVVHDLDQRVFAYLHPLCEDSDIRTLKGTKNPLYRLRNEEKRSTVKVSDRLKMSNIITLMDSMDKGDLRMVAKGLRIADVHKMKDIMVLDKLIEKLDEKDGYDTLRNALQGSSANIIRFRGTIQELVDLGVIGIDFDGNVRKWRWLKHTKQGQFITPILDGVSEFDSLTFFFESNPIEWLEYIKKTHEWASSLNSNEDLLAKHFSFGTSHDTAQKEAEAKEALNNALAGILPTKVAEQIREEVSTNTVVANEANMVGVTVSNTVSEAVNQVASAPKYIKTPTPPKRGPKKK